MEKLPLTKFDFQFMIVLLFAKHISAEIKSD